MPRNKKNLLSNMTSMKIGGTLKHVFFPKNIDELAMNLRTIYEQGYNFYVLGGGTNTILGNQFDDNSSIINLRDIKKVTFSESSSKRYQEKSFGYMQVDPGADLQNIVNTAYSKHLAKFGQLNRIPGSIGGAIYGNAGAYGVEIGELVEKITVINLKTFFHLCQIAQTNNQISTNIILRNSLQVFNKKQSQFSYRNSIFKSAKHEFLIVQARLKSAKLSKKDFIIELENSYHTIAKIRDLNYPKNLKSPGSTFKNIAINDISQKSLGLIDKNWIYKNKIPVAKLLNTCDTVNQPINGVKMKDNHCNILTNQNSKNTPSTIEDVYNYLGQIKNEVAQKYQIILEEEIRLVDKFDSVSDIVIG